MNLPLFIARRYLFSKKSHNAINVISAISVCGIAIATIAIVTVLSVFNGFGGVVEGLFSAFDPHLKISVIEGKVFSYDTPEFERVLRLPGILTVSGRLEENALLSLKSSRCPCM